MPATRCVIAWWGAEVECVSAVARAERAGRLSASGASEGLRRLSTLRRDWHEVEPSEEVREAAKRLLRVHDLTGRGLAAPGRGVRGGRE